MYIFAPTIFHAYALPCSAGALIAALLLLYRTPFLRAIIASVAWATAVYVIISGGLFACLLKDCLGPDTVPSTGMEAVKGFIGFCAPFIGLSIPFWITGILAIRLGRKKRDRS